MIVLAAGVPAAAIAATAKKAPAPKSTPAEDFKACRTEVTEARFIGCDRAIASGRLNKQDLSVAYANRGTEWFFKNDLARAASDLDQAARLDPSNQWAFISKVRVLLARKDPTGALAAANSAIRIMATSYAYAVRGLALQALGRGEEAAADYNQALRLNHGPDEQQIAQRGLAELAAAPTGDPDTDKQDCLNLSGDAAIVACSRAIASGKFSGSALVTLYLDRAFEAIAKADYDRVLADSDAAIELDAGSATAHVYKARALLLGKHDFNGALAEANAGLRLTPDDVVGLVVRGEAERALGQNEAARADLTRALGLNPGSWSLPTAQAGLAALNAAAASDANLDAAQCHNNKSEDERRAACDRAIASGKLAGKELASLYEARAVIYDLAGDREHAIADFTEAIRLDPGNVDALAFRGYGYLAKKDYMRAITDFNEVMKRDLTNKNVLGNRARALFLNGNYDLAVLDYDALIGLDPSAYAYLGRGDALSKLGRGTAATADYNKVLSLDPDSQWGRAAQAGLQGFAGEYMAALDLVTDCRTMAADAGIAACDRVVAAGRLAGPDLAFVYEKRGGLYYAKSDYTHALADFSEAIRLDPSRKNAFGGRAETYRQLGRRDEAIADYYKVLSFSLYAFGGDLALKNTAEAGLKALGVDPQAADADAASCRRIAGDTTLPACDRAIASGKFVGHDLAQLYDYRAYAYSQRSDLEHAAADYGEEIKLEPSNATALANRCWAYNANKDFAHALLDCNESIRLVPNNAVPYAIRGHVLSALGRREEAIADYYKSLSLNPDANNKQWVEAGLMELGIDPAAADADAKQCHDLSGDPAIAACDRAIAARKFAGSALASVYSDRCYEVLNKADYDRAILDCNAAIGADPDAGYAHTYKARALLAKQDAKAAIIEANLGLAKIATSAYALAVRGEVERALGRFDEAKQDDDRAIALNPTGWTLQTAQAGLAALAAGAAAPDAAAGADPSLDPAGDQASCKGFSGKAALAACGRAIASGKFAGADLLELYKQRAGADEEIKDFNQAIADYGGMIRINPDIPDLFQKRADAYMNSNDLDRAIADYGEAIRRNPRSWASLSNRGWAYFGQNDFDRAIADFSAALALMQAPDSNADSKANVGRLILRGLAYTAKQDFDHATADLNEAIRLDPNNAVALVARGETLAAAGHGPAAAADFNKALSLGLDDDLKQRAQAGLAALNEDAIQCQKGDGDPAIAACGRAIASGRSTGTALAQLYNSRGGLLFDNNQFDASMADLDQAIRLDPKLDLAYLNRGYTDRAKKDDQRAIADFSEFIRLAPGKSIGYDLRGTVYLANQDYDHALADFDQAIKLDPKSAALWYHRASAYYNKKDYEHAVADYSEVIRLDPPGLQALLDRGDAYRQLGRRDEATADYNRVLSISQDAAFKKAAQTGLTLAGAAK
jgi:tetratricopeptide (TPR) repeat protein